MKKSEKAALQVIGKAARAKRGKRTQKAIEDASGIPQSVISRIETADYPALTPALILRLCLALECRPSELVDLDQVYVIAQMEAEKAAA